MATLNRTQRRREETRARLLEAGRRVFADKGVDMATVQDITEAADIGRGSFYNFFTSKEELAEAIAGEVSKQLVQLEEQVSAKVEDPVRCLAIILRYGARATAENPALAWFALRSGSVGGEVATTFEALTSALIQRGRDTGAFTIESTELAYTMLVGMLTAGLEARLLGRLPPDSNALVIEHVLRLLGVSPKRARAIVAEPLPDLEQDPR